MKKIVFALFLLITTGVFTACDENIIEPESFSIKYGTECGWCAGEEFITITSTKIEYQRTIPCGDQKGTTNKNMELCSCELEALRAAFDYELFKTLEYNECNVCADGCDEIILITDEESSHEISYSISDEVEGMKELRVQLALFMANMRKLD